MKRARLLSIGGGVIGLILAAMLCAAPYPTAHAQQDPTILARQAELAATAQIIRATDQAAERERTRIAAEAAADAARKRADAQATAIVLNAQNTASAAQATGTAIAKQTSAAYATGTAWATATQIAGTARAEGTQSAATETAAPIRTADALAYAAAVHAQQVREQKDMTNFAGTVLLLLLGAVFIFLMAKFAWVMKRPEPVVIVENEGDGQSSQPAVDFEKEGAAVFTDPRAALYVMELLRRDKGHETV